MVVEFVTPAICNAALFLAPILVMIMYLFLVNEQHMVLSAVYHQVYFLRLCSAFRIHYLTWFMVKF